MNSHPLEPMFIQPMSGQTDHSIQHDSCMFLGFYGSVTSGLQARMHTGTVVTNNKALIFL